jgi:hypothetical protein
VPANLGHAKAPSCTPPDEQIVSRAEPGSWGSAFRVFPAEVVYITTGPCDLALP